MTGSRIVHIASVVALVSGILVVSAVTSAPAGAANDTVTLKFVIEAVRALDDLDTLDGADFYPEVSLAGGPTQGGAGLEITDDDDITPNWTFTAAVPLPSAATTASIHLELWDADGAFNGPRDHVDITTGDGDRNLDLTVNLTDCALREPLPATTITGDSSGVCGTGLVTNGTDSDRASLRFEVSVEDADRDGDGLLDPWEANGYDADGNGIVDVNLPAMGANPDHKDLFLELDTTAASTLGRADILAMKKAFAAAPIDAGTQASQLPGGIDAKPNPDGQRGINLHVDTGNVVDPGAREGQPLATCNNGIDDGGDGTMDAADPDCSGGGKFLDASTEDPKGANCTDGIDNNANGLADGSDPTCLLGDNLGGGNRVMAPNPPACNLDPQFYALKGANFAATRDGIFRYAVSLALDATCPPSGGWGEIGGNDFMEFNFDGGTVMHEFGHTLNLDHGGFESLNCKPNYLSGMNYDNQFAVRRAGGGSIIDYAPPRIALDGSTRGSVTPMISESSLDENTVLDSSDAANRFVFTDSTGAKRNTTMNANPNYNNDADPPLDSGFAGNVDTSNTAGNPSDCTNASSSSTLNSQSDWLRISLPFRQFGKSANGPINPVTSPEPTATELRALEDSINATDLSVTKSGPAGPLAAGTDATYQVTVRNVGANPAPGVMVQETLPTGTDHVSNTGECTVSSPSTLECDFGELAPGASRSFAVTVAVHRDLVYLNGSPLTVTNSAAGTAARGTDPQPGNNTGTASTGIVAVADLGVAAPAIPGAPTELIIGKPQTVTLRSTVSNAGPSAPMDTTLTTGASAQAGSTATPATQSTVLAGVDMGAPRTSDAQFELSCQAPGTHTFTFSAAVAPTRPDDTDPVAANNSATTTLALDCVVPVAVNIKPSGTPNSINRNSSSDIPLAVLTTNAGEYGLPLAFDATKIQPLTTRFGPIHVVNAGRGATETHRRNHLERSYELDETTRDADLDDVLHYSPAASELALSTTQGCVKGKFTGPAGQAWTFLGCDAVRIIG